MNGAGKSQLRVHDFNYLAHFTRRLPTMGPEGTGNEHEGNV